MLLWWLWPTPDGRPRLPDHRYSTALVVVTASRVMFLSLICRNASHTPVSRRSPIFGGAVTTTGLSPPFWSEMSRRHSPCIPALLICCLPQTRHPVSVPCCPYCLSVFCCCCLYCWYCWHWWCCCSVVVVIVVVKKEKETSQFPRGQLPKTNVVNTTGCTRHPEVKKQSRVSQYDTHIVRKAQENNTMHAQIARKAEENENEKWYDEVHNQ